MPSYLTKPPQNPFELSKNEASRLGYPRNVRNLNIPAPPCNSPCATLSRFEPISADFFDDLVCSTKPIHTIMRNYDRSRVDSLKADIISYFSYLQDRLLPQRDLFYEEIVECCQVVRNRVESGRVNYASYGTPFWDWLSESKLFKYDTLRSYSVLLHVCLGKFPVGILKLHEKLREANLDLAKYQPRKGHFDYEMVTFNLPDSWSLHNSLKQIRSLSEQRNHFNSSVSPSNRPWKNFLIQELKKCLNYYEIDFGLLEYGVLMNGSSLYNRFAFVLTFKDDHVNIPDWSTLYLTLKAIRKHFYRNYEIKVNEHVNDDDVSICIKFVFGDSSRFGLYDCEMKLDTDFVSTWQLIRFLSKCDDRFLDMTLALNYWASSLGFYDQHFSHLSLVLMVIFVLQQTNPPVFMALNKLITYDNDGHCYGTEFPEEHKFTENPSSICTNSNQQTTGELIVEFFRYYHLLDFENSVICTVRGETEYKSEYYDDDDDKFLSWISVEDPFIREIDESVICKKQSMHRFRECLEFYLIHLKLNSTNYLQVLTNPQYFDLKSDIYKRNSRFNSAEKVLTFPTVPTSRIELSQVNNYNSTPLESSQIDVKVVNSPVQAQLLDLSPITSTSDQSKVAVSTMVGVLPVQANSSDTTPLIDLGPLTGSSEPKSNDSEWLIQFE